MCLAQGPQSSDAGEARTRGPSVSSQALYHWATLIVQEVPEKMKPIFNSFIQPVKSFIYQYLGILFIHSCVK